MRRLFLINPFTISLAVIVMALFVSAICIAADAPMDIPPSQAVFNRSLSLGSIGDDVRALQVFLNNNGFIVATSGIGSPGQETSYFGSLTRSALAAFQAKSDIRPSVGYFGPITKARIISLLSSEVIPSTAELKAKPPIVDEPSVPVVPELSMVSHPDSIGLTTPQVGTISIIWKKGAAMTVIRRGIKNAPTSLSEGVEIYKGMEEIFDDRSFPSEGTICYSAWGYDQVSGRYSSSYVSKCLTLFIPGKGGSSFAPVLAPSALASSDIGRISMDISFTKGSGSTNTRVRRAIGVAPGNTGGGTLVYSGTGSSFTDSGLSPDTEYCYSAWGYDSPTDRYSGTYASICETTDASGLLAHWTLDEASGLVAADTSGNGYDGTWSDAGSHSVAGKIGDAADFTGTNYIDIPIGLFNSRTAFTLSYWLNADFIADMDTAFCAEVADTSWRLCTFSDSIRIRDNDNLTHDIDMFPVGDLQPSTWYNMTYVYDGSISEFIPYVNGVSLGVTSVGTAMKADIGSVRIGASLDPGYEFNGLMDDVLMYSVPLSPTEVNSIYLAGN
ncbi:MAG: peptidoglycan-binding protein [Candidatus Colwellbacteria bacterium]|nr:peptidoglycan-binding protein [Candidatus Colwellbacteria bacterium]